jgi:hypothetical protein
VEAARPRRASLLSHLDREADHIRQELRAVETALGELRSSEVISEGIRRRIETQVFTQGRIHQYLIGIRQDDDDELIRLRNRAGSLTEAVRALEDELDPDEEREQLASRINIIGRDMTDYAERLKLEHSGSSLRLDLKKLTVVADIATGPAPLYRFGSGENWVGSHLVFHLALHRFFVLQGRPVPHFLMLDQPTQAYYPSEVSRNSGEAERDEDRIAVRRLYKLLVDVMNELSPSMQIIVCDHANLPETWFQESVVHNWRGGRKLIPQSWIDRMREQ